jgi:hypothetical protein
MPERRLVQKVGQVQVQAGIPRRTMPRKAEEENVAQWGLTNEKEKRRQRKKKTLKCTTRTISDERSPPLLTLARVMKYVVKYIYSNAINTGNKCRYKIYKNVSMLQWAISYSS